MLWLTFLLPVAGASALWPWPAIAARGRDPQPADEARDRWVLGVGGVTVVVATLALAMRAAVTRPRSVLEWGGGLILTLEVDRTAAVVAVLVPVVAAPIVAYAAAHEPHRGLGRLVALLVAFVGAMQLLVVAGDLLTLLIGWELVGAVSWALIGHEWWQPEPPGAAAHAFNVTRFGDLGLFLAAAAAFHATGSLRYADLGALDGAALHVVVAGSVLAAAAKSAQVPFSPWLFSAMRGPTPVSALLHAATMVAAGAYLLARLQPVLAMAWWFGPTAIGLGLATALTGGVVAALHPRAKELLAASTSAQYGLMFVAVGAGSTAAGLAHLVAHAAFKSLLFLAAGVAIAAVGSGRLGRMRLGAPLRTVALLTLTGTLALAAIPPLGGAWTKEEVVAAAGERAPWVALLTIAAGGLSAFYAARFQLLAYGPTRRDGALRHVRPPGRTETIAIGVLATFTVALGLLWIPGAGQLVETVAGGTLPEGRAWELVVSLLLVGAGTYAAVVLARRQQLATLGTSPHGAADWLGIPTLAQAAVIDPTLALCRTLARFDDRVVDAGVRAAAAVARAGSRLVTTLSGRGVDGAVEALAAAARRAAGAGSRFDDAGVDGVVEALAAGVGAAGRDSRRLQTGYAHHYYVIVAAGAVVTVVALALWA
ncbi:MAG TPA: proton-conducting transporter membrane subunit [Nitriliruptorales bacterium]|nr:proton-conducting transporter membrane subunit [Nitriliruptorales bacterium]